MISLCVIARNEADCIGQCLESAQGLVDEMIVLDTGSEDSTPDIARELGAEVYFAKWESNFAAARNLSLARAAGDWILVLDADERLAPESFPYIRAAVSRDPAIYELLIENLTDSANPNQATMHYGPRLFPMGLRFRGRIHEQLDSDLPRTLLPQAKIIHSGYLPAVVQKKNKVNRNLPLLIAEAEEKPFCYFAQYNLAQAYLALGRVEEAEAAYWKVTEWAPHNAGSLSNAWVQLIALASTRKDFTEAWRRCELALPACKLNPDYWINRGGTLASLGKIAAAIESYTEAYELGQKPVYCGVYEKSSVTTRPFDGIARAYRLAGQDDLAKLFEYEQCA